MASNNVKSDMTQANYITKKYILTIHCVQTSNLLLRNKQSLLKFQQHANKSRFA